MTSSIIFGISFLMYLCNALSQVLFWDSLIYSSVTFVNASLNNITDQSSFPTKTIPLLPQRLLPKCSTITPTTTPLSILSYLPKIIIWRESCKTGPVARWNGNRNGRCQLTKHVLISIPASGCERQLGRNLRTHWNSMLLGVVYGSMSPPACHLQFGCHRPGVTHEQWRSQREIAVWMQSFCVTIKTML